MATDTVHVATVDEAPGCRHAARQQSTDRFLTAFRAARLSGSGATVCLTPAARHAYCDQRHCGRAVLQAAPGPICLYGCFGYRLVDLTVVSLSRSPAGDLTAYVEALFRGPAGRIFRDNESLSLTKRPHLILISYASSAA